MSQKKDSSSTAVTLPGLAMPFATYETPFTAEDLAALEEATGIQFIPGADKDHIAAALARADPTRRLERRGPQGAQRFTGWAR